MSPSSSSSPSSRTPSYSLADYGWDEARERAFAPHRAAGLLPARIVRAERGLCEAVTDTGAVRAAVPGGAADRADPQAAPCTGDWVALRPAGAEPMPTLHAVLERRTALVRSSASRSSHGQVLAANVDTVAVTVRACLSGARPVVVLTKADACADPERAAAEVAEVAPGADVLVTSAVTGQGVDTLTSALTGTVVLLGPSGAGKSTLGNQLLGEELLATGAVRETDGRGRHTTAWRELLPLPGGGVLLDAPGLRAIGLHDAADGLERTFADVERLAEHCRFADCAHSSEPGCAVLAAVESGELPGRRLDSYRKLLRENAHAASRTDARLRSSREAANKRITRQLRATYRFRERQ